MLTTGHVVYPMCIYFVLEISGILCDFRAVCNSERERFEKVAYPPSASAEIRNGSFISTGPFSMKLPFCVMSQ